jgi:hypothetical protein
MIGITIDGQQADLLPKTTVNLIYKCPVFDEQNTGRAFSLPLRFPNSPRMKVLFRHFHRLDSKRVFGTIPMTITAQNVPIATGEYVPEKITENIDGHFTNKAKSYVDALEKIKIRDILGTIFIPQISGEWKFITDPPTERRSYFFWINGNPIGYQATETDTSFTVASHFTREIRRLTGLIVSNWYQLNAFKIISDGENVQIRPFMKGFTFVSKRTYIQARQQAFRDFMETTLNNPRQDVSFVRVRNPNFYENSPRWGNWVNKSNVLNGRWSIPDNNINRATPDTLQDWEYAYTPFVRVKHILEKIVASVGASSFTGDFPQWGDMMNSMVIYNSISLDEVVKEWEAEEWEQSCNVHKKEIRLADHVPDVTGKAFLNFLCENCNMKWEANNMEFKFSLKEKELNQPESDLIRFDVSPDSVERSFLVGDGFTMEYSQADTDSFRPAPFKRGNGDLKVTLETGSLAEFHDYGFISVLSTEKANQKDTAPMRFMLDRGVQRATYGEAYWMSTVGNVAPNGDIIGSVSLTLEGLHNWAFKKYLQIMSNGFKVDFKVSMNVAKFTQLIEFKQVVYRIDTNDGNARIAIQQIETAVDENGISSAKISAIAF